MKPNPWAAFIVIGTLRHPVPDTIQQLYNEVNNFSELQFLTSLIACPWATSMAVKAPCLWGSQSERVAGSEACCGGHNDSHVQWHNKHCCRPKGSLNLTSQCVCVYACVQYTQDAHIIFKAGNVVHFWVVSCLPNTPGTKPNPHSSEESASTHFLSGPIFYSFPSLYRYLLLPPCLFPLSRSSHVDLHMSGYFSGHSSLSTNILPRLFWASHLKQLPTCHISTFFPVSL